MPAMFGMIFDTLQLSCHKNNARATIVPGKLTLCQRVNPLFLLSLGALWGLRVWHDSCYRSHLIHREN